MSLAPELLKILVCPKCKGELDYRESESALVCPAWAWTRQMKRYDRGF